MFTAPSAKNLEGGFKELDFARNENNTGPIHRAYVYEVADTLWEQMKLHTDLLPHSKYGTTEVFYFLPNQFNGTIELKNGEVNLLGNNQDAYLSHTVKNGMGKIQSERNPF